MNYVCPTREDDEKEEAVRSDGNCSPLEIDYVPGNGFSLAGRPNRRSISACGNNNCRKARDQNTNSRMCALNVITCTCTPALSIVWSSHLPCSIRHGLLAVSANQRKGRLSSKADRQTDFTSRRRQSSISGGNRFVKRGAKEGGIGKEREK